MSLLNEMLKDINENKDRVNANPSFIPRQKLSFIHNLPDFAPWILGIVVVSLIIVLIAHGFGLNKRADPPTLQPTVSRIAANIVSALQFEYIAINPAFAPSQQTTTASQALAKKTDQSAPEEILQSSLASVPPFLGGGDDPQDYSLQNPDFSSEPDGKNGINKVFTSMTAEELHEYQLNQALEAIEAGNDPEAIRLLELVLAKFPQSVEARESLAAIYLARADLPNAMRVLDDGLQLTPNSVALSTMKARLLFEQDQTKEALALLQHFNPNIQTDPDFYGLMAAVLQSLGRVNDAGSLYKSLVEIEPSNGQYWLGYGIALEQKRATQQAIAAYKRASESYNVESPVRVYAENRLKILQG